MKRTLLAFGLVFCLVAASCSTTQTVTVTQVKTTTPVKNTKPPVTYRGGVKAGLTFTAKIGDRVVSTIGPGNQYLFCFIKDPNGNIVAESSRKTVTYMEPAQYYVPGGQLLSPAKVVTEIRGTQEYPWVYSFYATTTGEYTIGATKSDSLVFVVVYPAS